MKLNKITIVFKMILLNRKVLILTFCSIGCLTHLAHVVNEFLKFPVRTDIIYDYPKKMIVPEIDIFLYNIDLLNLTEIYLRHPKEMKGLCESKLQSSNLEIISNGEFNPNCSRMFKSYFETGFEISSMLTIGDIENLNVDSLIHKNDFNNSVRNDLCTMKKYFSSVSTFIRISCREDSKPIEKRLVPNADADDRFCILHNIHQHFGVRFAHPNSTINPTILNYVKIEREKNESVFTFLRQREITIERSEWPYQTNCRHYQRAEAYNQCLHDKITRVSPGTVGMLNVIQVGDFPSNYTFDLVSFLDKSFLSQIRNECSKQVEQLQCIEKTYQTKGKTFKEGGTGIGLICLENQDDFNIILKTYPQSTFTELLIYISSILGIWFGISIYGKLLDGFIVPTIPKPTIKKIYVVPNAKRVDNQQL